MSTDGQTYKTTLREWTGDKDDAVVIFYKSQCPYCQKALAHLDTKDLKDKLVKVDIDIDDKFTEYRESMEEVTGCKTVPKVFENGVFIGDSGATIAHF
jgi:glutaredoxin 3